MLFADVCAACGKNGVSPCRACAARLSPPPNLPLPEHLDHLVALFAYEAVGMSIVRALKYRNQRCALRWLSRHMAEHVAGHKPEIVTWVPASRSGTTRRGFDTGELLARRIAHELHVPVRALLRRTGGEMQSVRSRVDRQSGPSLAANAGTRSLRLRSVLLVDDVSTTGASLSAAALALRTCGFRTVTGVVAARTPLGATG
jgi:ComF family protein